MFDQAKFLSEVHNNLVKAQSLLEDSAKVYGEYADQEAEATKEYREAKALAKKNAMSDGIPASATSEIVQGQTASLKAKLMKISGQKRKTLMMYEVMKERLYNIRHLSRGINPDLG